jgi:hypothetical protein
MPDTTESEFTGIKPEAEAVFAHCSATTAGSFNSWESQCGQRESTSPIFRNITESPTQLPRMAPELLKAQSLYPSADKVPDSVFPRLISLQPMVALIFFQPLPEIRVQPENGFPTSFPFPEGDDASLQI